ncbi:ketose-bisphosphate aldolase [Patescibacteria group bacterium]|nr:ketose-bisphosphate aldolase [Patescibacteria group bacterium]MCH8889384.1 ketose-bisphosphate aldolase [Patescibacteria group bacterium]
MYSLRDVVSDAESKKVAVGHFNISDSTQLWGIFRAAKNLNVPVIIGTSEGERDFIGARQAVALVTSIREEYNYPIFINADHHYSLKSVKEVIDAGYDAVIFDGSKVTHKENIAITKACVEYARASGRDIIVEGELGNIGQSSKLLEAIPEGAEITKEMMTKPDELKAFVEETGVDLIAPAVGNLHGMLKHGKNPNLSIERIQELREAGGVPMVLHGGSGISDVDFRKGIEAGMCMVHINTEIRKAYRDGIEEALKDNPDEIAPYRFMKRGCDNLEAVVSKRLKLFNNL